MGGTDGPDCRDRRGGRGLTRAGLGSVVENWRGGAGGGREGAGASKEQGEACERTGSAAKEQTGVWRRHLCVRYNETIVGTVVFISEETYLRQNCR